MMIAKEKNEKKATEVETLKKSSIAMPEDFKNQSSTSGYRTWWECGAKRLTRRSIVGSSDGTRQAMASEQQQTLRFAFKTPKTPTPGFLPPGTFFVRLSIRVFTSRPVSFPMHHLHATGLHATIARLVILGLNINDIPIVDGALHYQSLTELNAILRMLSTHAKCEVDAVLQDELLSFAQNEVLTKAAPADVAPAALAYLDRHLAARVYLVARTATAADYTLYAALHSVLSALKDAATKYPSVCRWFNFMQHSKVARSIQDPLSVVNFRLSSLEQFGAIEMTLDETGAAVAAAPVAAAAPAGDEKKKEEKKKEKKEEKPKEEKKKDEDDDESIGLTLADLYRFDMRVGKITKVENHPGADSLYVEEIDIGEKKLQVVSGLRKWVPLEQMQDRLVVLFVNLKPSAMRGVTSSGMVLCASTENAVEPILPPAGAVIGERITFAGASYATAPDAPVAPKKLHKLLKELSSSAEGVVQFKDVPFTVSAGSCTSTIKNAPVK
jgi:aminoacyl tRNA synthase complex-interacting multifunctional protein 1